MNLPPRDERPPVPADIPDDDPSIPVLSERLHLHALEIDMDLPPQARPAQQESATAEPAAPAPAQQPTADALTTRLGQAAGAPPAIDIDALREALLARMQGKITEQINATLRDLLQPAIDDAVLRLADEAKFALRLTLQELIERALREELKAREAGAANADDGAGA